MEQFIMIIFMLGMIALCIWASDGAFKENEKTEKKKFEYKQLKKGQYNFCYCECGNELISSNSFLKDTDFVYYKCSKCGKITKWDFDAPCPIFVDTVEED